MAPEVTLIIATYNGRRFLRQAIQSVLQGDLSLEVLIVDDGSTDDTVDTVSDLPVCIIQKERNLGTAAAYNSARERARGRFIGFMDHDDLLFPGSLKARMDWLKAHPEENVVRGVVAGMIDAAGTLLGDLGELFDGAKEALPSVITPNYLRECLKAGKPFLCAPWLHLYRAEFLKELGPFDESLKVAHDVEYLLRIVTRSSLPVAPIPTVYYRMHETNTSGVLTREGFQVYRRTIAESSLVLWSYGYT